MSITKIVRKVFEPRQKELEKHFNQGKALQEAVLGRLVAEAQDTEYGRNHAFTAMKGYEDFVHHIPVNTYKEITRKLVQGIPKAEYDLDVDRDELRLFLAPGSRITVTAQ